MTFTMSGSVRLSSVQSRQNGSVKNCETIGVKRLGVTLMSTLCEPSAMSLCESARAIAVKRRPTPLSLSVKSRSIAPAGLTGAISQSTAKAGRLRDFMDAHTISGRGYRAMARARWVRHLLWAHCIGRLQVTAGRMESVKRTYPARGGLCTSMRVVIGGNSAEGLKRAKGKS